MDKRRYGSKHLGHGGEWSASRCGSFKRKEEPIVYIRQDVQWISEMLLTACREETASVV
jgi:hypothetical protein